MAGCVIYLVNGETHDVDDASALMVIEQIRTDGRYAYPMGYRRMGVILPHAVLKVEDNDPE